MIKMIVSGRRKKGISLAEFDEYWNHRHGPLAQELAQSLCIKRYVQSIRVEAPGLELFSDARGGDEDVPDFFAELWFDSAEAMARAFASPEGRKANERLILDEEKFCDRTSFVCLVTEERLKIG